MLTFSKNAKDDFIMKMKKNKVDEVPVKNINTIDSFAWAIIGEELARSIDVSILSYSLLRLLVEIKAVKQKEISNPHLTRDDIEFLTPIITSFGVDFDDLCKKLKNIKCIFVDEAQDLNEIQYNILIHLKWICDASLNLIGDPNQNIYQFRNSSDKYLVEYPAQTFHLTKNYRSKGHIVQFCSHLRPYNTSEITYHEEEKECKPIDGDGNAIIDGEDNRKKSVLDVTFYSYANTNCFESYILSILHFFKAKQIPLHKVAILAPTRGYLRTVKGISKYKGLCYIANLLFKNDIPFQQFYNDIGSGNNMNGCGNDDSPDSNINSSAPISEIDSSKVAYKMKRGHINLMTYTASKGLEWDYVIIIDADAHLISRWEYNVDKYNAEKYLLYVACSRPRKNLIIFTKHRFTNPWFKDVPNDKYKLARICRNELEFFDSTRLFTENRGRGEKKVEEKEEKEEKMDIDLPTIPISSSSSPSPDTKNLRDSSFAPEVRKPPSQNPKDNVMNLVNLLSEAELFDINSMILGYINKTGVMLDPERKTGWKLKVPDNRQGFTSKFLEHLFYVHAFDTHLSDTPMMRDIRNVIESKNILYCNSDRIISWYFANRESMTWESYDVLRDQIHEKITQFVDSRFDKDQSFSSYTLVDKFYDSFIAQNFEVIKSTYNKYIKSPKCLDHILYITLVSYAVESTHYFYILQFDKFNEEIIPKNEDVFNCVMRYASSLKMSMEEASYKKRIMNGELLTFIDFKRDGILHKLKPTGDEKLKDIVNALIAIMMENGIDSRGGDNKHCMRVEFKTIILSKGIANDWKMDLPKIILKQIYDIVIKKIVVDLK